MELENQELKVALEVLSELELLFDSAKELNRIAYKEWKANLFTYKLDKIDYMCYGSLQFFSLVTLISYAKEVLESFDALAVDDKTVLAMLILLNVFVAGRFCKKVLSSRKSERLYQEANYSLQMVSHLKSLIINLERYIVGYCGEGENTHMNVVSLLSDEKLKSTLDLVLENFLEKQENLLPHDFSCDLYDLDYESALEEYLQIVDTDLIEKMCDDYRIKNDEIPKSVTDGVMEAPRVNVRKLCAKGLFK